MSPSEDKDGNAGRPSRWVKSNLVALGSAAVLAVYSAGYARTRTAAERFAEETTNRRPPERRVSPAASETAPAARSPEVEPDASAAPAPAVGSPAVAASPSAAAAEKKPDSAKPTPAPSVPEKTARSSVTTDTATTPVKVNEPAAPVAAVPTPAPAPATPPTPPADTAKSADTTHVQLKDGTFSGWGTSRHGDIEAAVQIKDGRIVSSFIVQCLTRYSCSWISMLPGQVVTRQSAEVDYVSGATQSSNAFYYAIVEALSKAK